MTTSFSPKILTARALVEGCVVYMAPDGHWTRRRADAELIEDAITAALRLLDAEARGHEVVDARLAEAGVGSGRHGATGTVGQGAREPV